MLFSDAHPSSKEVNGFWFHSTEGQQLLKLGMGEHAISASCRVKTSSGVHHLNYNRWGDSTQRFVPYNGNQMKGKKATMELHRYLRESSTRRQPVRFGPIPRNPSLPGNRRARGLREGRNSPAPRRRYYSPEIEPLSEEDTRRQAPAPFSPAYRRGRKYPSRAFRQDTPARRAPTATQSKRSRTPSPEVWPHQRGQGILSQGPHPQKAPTAAQASGSETDSASPPEQQESPYSPREDSQKTLAEEERELIEQKTKELIKEKERLDKENEKLDKENDELDRWIEKRERMNKWLDEVSEALKQGAPVPDQPEDPEIVYPGYREDNETSEDAPGAVENAPTPSAVEAPAQGTPENFTSGPHPQEEEAPTNQVEGPQKDQDRVPLDQAVSELCGNQEAERPPVPIEANVIVVNRAPAAPDSPTPDQDIINVEDNGQEYDSDCQIVEGPPGPSTSEQTKPEPSGLWRLKKQFGRPLQIKLIRSEKEEQVSAAVPAAPPPTPAPGVSRGWDSQEEQLKQDSEDPKGPQNSPKDEDSQDAATDKDPQDPSHKDDREQNPESPVSE